MPVYEYRCRSCGKTHDIERGFHDKRPTECPSCGGELVRVFHPIGLVFKGSGFHKTDYAGSSGRGGAGAATDGKSSEGKSSEGKSSEAKSSESKSSEGKASESKSSESKSSEGKSSDA